jgi:pimeloyl-ACP methyl ester carboxylesterase
VLVTLVLVREYRVDSDGVPARVYEPPASRGLLFLGHRGTHSKDDPFYVDLGRQLASDCNLTVACIDAPCHGERKPDSGDQAADDAAVLDAIVSGAEQTAADWIATASTLSAFGPPIAFVGFSMGALTGLVTAGLIPSIRTLVLGVAGVPAFAVQGKRDPGSTTPQLSAAASLGDVDVLMLNMTRDDLCPPSGALELFDAIPGARKRLTFWEGDHDHVPPELVGHLRDFVRQSLAEEPDRVVLARESDVVDEVAGALRGAFPSDELDDVRDEWR